MPQGAILAARADDNTGSRFGCNPNGYVPVVYLGDTVLMAASTAQAPVRLGALVPGEPPMPPVKPDAKKDDKAKADDKGKPDAKGDEEEARCQVRRQVQVR